MKFTVEIVLELGNEEFLALYAVKKKLNTFLKLKF
jgi:hypothetical protein